MVGKRYENIFSYALITVEKVETTDTGTIVHYRKDRPNIVNMTNTYQDPREIYNFVKPLRVFERQYKQIT